MSQYRRRQAAIRRAQRQRMIVFITATLLLVLMVFGCVRFFANVGGGRQDKLATNENPPTQSEGEAAGAKPDDAGTVTVGAGADVPVITPEPTPKVKMLPIIYRKKDEKKRICITIDDCFSADNVRAIVKLAEKYGADLTFFPKGQTIKDNADLWRELYDKGYEIENHSYHHTNVSELDEEQLRNTIIYSEMALNEALGVNYHMRLFRCPTGDGMKDPRLHTILRELGYEAVASWGLSGTQDASIVLRQARPGQLLLFHATKDDYEKLKVVIPGLAKKGYKMVSINTMYGKGPNEVTDLDTYDHK